MASKPGAKVCSCCGGSGKIKMPDEQGGQTVTCATCQGVPEAATAIRSVADRLRACGFKIHSRPEGSLPVWEKNGRMYPQNVALTMVARMEQEKTP